MKKNKLRELLCALTAAVMVYLSACGQTNEKVDTNSTPEPTEVVNTETPEEKAPEINVPGLTINDTDKIVDEFSKEYDKLLVFLDFPNNKVYIKNEEINLSEYDYKLLYEDEEQTVYRLTKYSGFYYLGENLVVEIKGSTVLTMGYDVEYIFIESSEPTLVKKQG